MSNHMFALFFPSYDAFMFNTLLFTDLNLLYYSNTDCIF